VTVLAPLGSDETDGGEHARPPQQLEPVNDRHRCAQSRCTSAAAHESWFRRTDELEAAPL